MALEALKACMRSDEWEPTPAGIRAAYIPIRERREQERRERTKQLNEPEISEEQAEENRRLIKEYAKKIGVGGTTGIEI